MAIAYKSQGAGFAIETNNALLQPVCPAVVDVNDILVAHVVHLAATSTAPATPSGWTLLGGPSNIGTTATGRHWLFGKLAAGTEDGAAISFGAAGGLVGQVGRIYSFSGYVSGTITQIIPDYLIHMIPHATDPQGPNISVLVPGGMAVALLVQDDNNTLGPIAAATNGGATFAWTEPVAEFVDIGVGPQGAVIAINTGVAIGNGDGSGVGGIGKGAVAATNDESGTIGFAIHPSPYPAVAGDINRCFVEGGYSGPYMDPTTGHLYLHCEEMEATGQGTMLKSADGGDSWFAVDKANQPPDLDIESSDIRLVGNTLHMVWQGPSSDDVFYSTFHTSGHGTNPDTWQIKELVTGASNPLEQCSAVEVRADGTIVAFWNQFETTAGTNDHVSYAIRSVGGVWGTPVVINAADGNVYGQVTTVKGANDLIYIVYKRNSGTILYRTLTSADVLSGETVISNDGGTASTNDNQPVLPLILHTDGGNEIVTVAYKRGVTPNDDFIALRTITNNTTISGETIISDNAVAANVILMNNRQPVATLVRDTATGELHLFYANVAAGVNPVANNGTIFHAKTTAGVWGTDVAEMTGIDCHAMRAGVHTYPGGGLGTDRVIGLYWDTGSLGKEGSRYDEFVLPPVAVTGVALGAVSAVGSASGVRIASGQAAGVVVAAGTASGTVGGGAVTGVAAGAVSAVGTVAGTVTHTGVAVGAASAVGSASGNAVKAGQATGAVVAAGTAAGLRTVTGAAAGAVSAVGSASGSTAGTVVGVATGAVTAEGVAVGVRTAFGAAVGSATAAGAATGVRTVVGAALGAATASGTALGQVAGVVTGQALGAVVAQGAAVGVCVVVGQATGAVAALGVASGQVSGTITGAAVGQVTAVGVATGVRIVRATAVGAVVAQGSASGHAVVIVFGVAVGAVTAAGTANGVAGPAITFGVDARGSNTPGKDARGRTLAGLNAR